MKIKQIMKLKIIEIETIIKLFQILKIFQTMNYKKLYQQIIMDSHQEQEEFL